LEGLVDGIEVIEGEADGVDVLVRTGTASVCGGEWNFE